MLLKIIQAYKLTKFHDKLVQNFLDYISDDKHSFIDFLLKNNFTYSTNNKLLIFYKIGIVDNSVLTYADETDIKISYDQAFREQFIKHLAEFDVNVDQYYELDIDVCNVNLLEYSKINMLSNGYDLSKTKLQQLITTNLIDNAEVSNKLDKEQIYLYKIEYKLIDINKYVEAYKTVKFWNRILLFSCFAVALIAIISSVKYLIN